MSKSFKTNSSQPGKKRNKGKGVAHGKRPCMRRGGAPLAWQAASRRWLSSSSFSSHHPLPRHSRLSLFLASIRILILTLSPTLGGGGWLAGWSRGGFPSLISIRWYFPSKKGPIILILGSFIGIWTSYMESICRKLAILSCSLECICLDFSF